MSDNSIALSQKIADFMTKAESDHQAIALDRFDLSRHFEEKESSLNKVLNHISDEIKTLKEHMARSNTQWRKDTQQLLNDNQNEITSISALYHETHTHILAQCGRLNQATMSTVKNAAQFFVSLKNNSLQNFAENKHMELEKTHEKDLHRVKNTLRSLRWKNLFTTLCLSLIISFIISLYIDNESPWMAHKQVMQQREDGKILLASWSHLSPHDQNILAQSG